MNKYPSINNNKASWVKRFKSTTDEEWVVTQKAHGAHLSFIFDGESIHVTSRNQLLGKPEDVTFFDCGHHIVKWEKELQPLLSEVFNSNEASSVIVYGELVGGVFSHIDVEPHPDGRKIQVGDLQYCPNNMFYAFDILVISSDGQEQWMDYDKAVGLFHKHNVFCAEIDFRGTLEECLAFSEKTRPTPSDIPKRLGLPQLKSSLREGNVLKPVIARFLPTGSRVVIKDKNEETKPGCFVAKRPKVEEPPIPQNKDEEMKQKLSELLDESRLQSVLSKVGLLSKSIANNVIREMVNDVFEEMKRDEDPLYKEFCELRKKHQGMLTSYCMGIAKKIVFGHLESTNQ
jgi:Rnl2 family RNA ligase